MKQLASTALWDQAAATFDEAADHGLRDPLVRRAWHNLLQQWLPVAPATILDIGCGTGSLSVLLAALGYDVTGIDFSSAMIAQAQSKAQAAGLSIDFMLMDAANPQLAPRQFDLIVCRHLLWTLSELALVLRRWATLLHPKGRLVLIEGFWHTGVGLHAQEIVTALPTEFSAIQVQNLSDLPALWGAPITDERFAVICDLPR